jgi:hypothetical protein
MQPVLLCLVLGQSLRLLGGGASSRLGAGLWVAMGGASGCPGGTVLWG